MYIYINLHSTNPYITNSPAIYIYNISKYIYIYSPTSNWTSSPLKNLGQGPRPEVTDVAPESLTQARPQVSLSHGTFMGFNHHQ